MVNIAFDVESEAGEIFNLEAADADIFVPAHGVGEFDERTRGFAALKKCAGERRHGAEQEHGA